MTGHGLLVIIGGVPGTMNLLWGGFLSCISEVTVFSALIAVYRKHACHQRWCWRLAHHPQADPATGLTHMLCRRHHPDHPGRKLTGADFALIAARRESRKS